MLYESIVTFIETVLIEFVTAFGGIITTLFNAMYIINRIAGFDELVEYITYCSGGFVILVTIKVALDTYVLNTEGDPDSDPLDLVSRGIETITVIYGNSLILETLIKMAAKLNKEILELDFLALPEVEDGNLMKDFYETLKMSGRYSVVVLLIGITVVVSLVITCFKASKRGAELELIRVLLPIFAADLMTTTREKWKNFIWKAVAVIFGYVLQMVSLLMTFKFMLEYIANGNILYSYGILGWVILCVKAPEWLNEFLYSSGVGQMAKGGMQTGVSAAMLMRFR